MLIIGSHVSFGKNQLLGATEEAISYGSNTFMFYTGAPTNTVRKDIEKKYTEEAINLMQANNIDIKNVVCHAPYIVNLGNASDPDKYNFSKDFIKKELTRCDEMGITKMVLHPGNAIGITPEEGLNNIAEALNYILDGTTKCLILLETMAGKGTECGRTTEELAYIINKVDRKEQIGVCLDTCHLNDSGYNIKEFDKYLDEFDSLIGIDKIKCVHINDSKNDQGSHKDRHANFGMGSLGFDTLINVIYNERLTNVPKILETPYIGDTDDSKERIYPPYKYEIEMIRNKEFDPSFLDKIRQNYKK
ncbi:MAG: deoxyribonuclease IV [Firmicutes bacterium]|nr:deoxyribonuclease IV [Bacillota bacterium]